MRRAIVVPALFVALLALAVQIAGDGLYGTLAVPDSLPHALAGEWPFALAARSGLDRIGAIRIALARGAIVRGEPARAAELLAPLAPSPAVLDLRGRVAQAQNDAAAALRDFLAAGDFVAAEPLIAAIGARDPVAGLPLVRDFERRLAAGGRGPEIGADADFWEGQMAASAAFRHPERAAAFRRIARDAYRRALTRAPDEETYLLNDGFTALVAGAAADARARYARAAQVVPDSVDAYVGLAVAAAVLGDCPAARSASARAAAFAAEQHRNADPAAAGFAPAARAAYARCRP